MSEFSCELETIDAFSADKEQEAQEDRLDPRKKELEFILNEIQEMGGFNCRPIKVSVHIKKRIETEDTKFVEVCNETLVEYVDLLQAQEDLIHTIPIFKAIKSAHQIQNITITRESLREYQINKPKVYGVPYYDKKENIHKFYARICQSTEKKVYTKQQVEQIMMWYSTHSVAVVHKWVLSQCISLQRDFWRCVIRYYIARNTFDTHEVIDTLESIGQPCTGDDDIISDIPIIDEEIRNNRAFCYVIFIGCYLIKGVYKLVYKIGMSDRQEAPYDERFREHFKDLDYPDVSIIKIISCSNSTQLERIIKRTWKLNNIEWSNKTEVYATDGTKSIDDLALTFIEYKLHDSTRHDKILRETQIKILQCDLEKCEKEKEELEQMIAELIKQNTKKDEDIVRLKKLLKQKKT